MATKAKKTLDAKPAPRSARRDRLPHAARDRGRSAGRGRGFFYFAGAPVFNWLNRTVVTPELTSRTLGQWLEEYRRMAKQNSSADPFAPKPSKRKKAT